MALIYPIVFVMFPFTPQSASGFIVLAMQFRKRNAMSLPGVFRALSIYALPFSHWVIVMIFSGFH